ncbi:hypothetical protein FC92_GL000992 [Liquorilactobacillus hordei DSM 19519]|uniref:Uncharacterized protein n=2 Tax=Liquorilactobacillus hordei TaxID=468911 RepID=A0A0R1MS00_9LACO|nr:hypothetical protein FC92_GL000992 [Liquorilactobacillus hordei DSM 19519]
MQITRWKQNMMDTLCHDEDISKMLKYNAPDALTRDSLTEDDKLDLVNNRIFGTTYVPKTVEQQGSYITIGIGGFIPQESFRQFSERYVMGYLYFNILVDRNLMLMDEGYRQDLILQRVYDLFQDNNFYGMGRIQEGNLVENWEQDNRFGGYTLMFRVIDFK